MPNGGALSAGDEMRLSELLISVHLRSDTHRGESSELKLSISRVLPDNLTIGKLSPGELSRWFEYLGSLLYVRWELD